MNKRDFIKEVSNRCMVTPYVIDEIFRVLSDIVTEELLKGNQVEIPKMGKFSLKERKQTSYKKLFGKENCTVDGYTYPSFQVANCIKTKVRNRSKYPKIT